MPFGVYAGKMFFFFCIFCFVKLGCELMWTVNKHIAALKGFAVNMRPGLATIGGRSGQSACDSKLGLNKVFISTLSEIGVPTSFAIRNSASNLGLHGREIWWEGARPSIHRTPIGSSRVPIHRNFLGSNVRGYVTLGIFKNETNKEGGGATSHLLRHFITLTWYGCVKGCVFQIFSLVCVLYSACSSKIRQ